MAARDSVQDYIDSGTVVAMYCHNPACGHHGTLDLIALRDKLGPDHGMNFDHIAANFHCSKCKRQTFGMIKQDKLPPKVNAYRKAQGG